MPPTSPLRQRLIVAIPLAIVLLAAGFCVGAVGLAAGVMGGDSCAAGSPPTWVTLWLTIVWPLSVLVSAVFPPLLIALGHSYKIAALAFVFSVAGAVVVWLLWIPILGQYC
jgi:hypothetical protein